MTPNSTAVLAVGLLSAVIIVAALGSISAVAENPRMYPSTKHPDYPFSEAVAYNSVLYLAGEIGAGKTSKYPELSALAASGLALGASVDVECLAALN